MGRYSSRVSLLRDPPVHRLERWLPPREPEEPEEMNPGAVAVVVVVTPRVVVRAAVGAVVKSPRKGLCAPAVTNSITEPAIRRPLKGAPGGTILGAPLSPLGFERPIQRAKRGGGEDAHQIIRHRPLQRARVAVRATERRVEARK